MKIPRRTSAALTAVAVLAAGLAVVSTGTATPVAAAGDVVTWTDTFDGVRWTLVGPWSTRTRPTWRSRADSLRIAGQPGDTYQGVNTAKNIVMLDVPAGDFTATADVSAAVAKVYQGAGLIAWQDMDNYVRSGLTFVGGLSPSGTAIETDVESGGTFSAVSFADRPASSAERLRLQRVGDTITSSFWDGTAWVTAATTNVSFDTAQVGLYALAAQDGTVLPAAFDSFTIEHEPGADVTPTGPFVLQADGDAPYLVADGDVLTAQRPAADRQPAPAGDRPRRWRRRALHRRRPARAPRRRAGPRGGHGRAHAAADHRRRRRQGRPPRRGRRRRRTSPWAATARLVGGAEADAVRFVAVRGRRGHVHPQHRRRRHWRVDQRRHVRHLLRGHQLRRGRRALRRAGPQPVLRVQHLRQRLLHRPDRLAGPQPQRSRHDRDRRRRRHPAQRDEPQPPARSPPPRPATACATSATTTASRSRPARPTRATSGPAARPPRRSRCASRTPPATPPSPRRPSRSTAPTRGRSTPSR